MPASLTVEQLRNALHKFAGPESASDSNNEEFLAQLNQVADRIYNGGKWKRLDESIELTVDADGYVTLGTGYEAILACAVDGRPVDVWTKSTQWNPNGPGFADEPDESNYWGIVDKGYSDAPDEVEGVVFPGPYTGDSTAAAAGVAVGGAYRHIGGYVLWRQS